jgi:threonine synthase
MTCVLDANVHNVAVEGTFDDCQAIVKHLFTDADFRSRHNLAAINSINWARIMAQVPIVMYCDVSVCACMRTFAAYMWAYVCCGCWGEGCADECSRLL